MSVRFLLVLFVSVVGHVLMIVWWPLSAQEPELELAKGRISVELRARRASNPSPPRKRKAGKKIEKKIEKKKKVETKPQTKPKPPKPSPKPKKIKPTPKKIKKTVEPPKKKTPPLRKTPKPKTQPITAPAAPSQPQPKRTNSVPKSQGVRTPSRLVGRVQLQYPEEARRFNIQGRVVVWLHIAATGRVVQAKVQQSSGSALLDNAALRGAYSLVFSPARRGGVPIASTRVQNFNYRLTD